jgi:hypothetical protein
MKTINKNKLVECWNDDRLTTKELEQIFKCSNGTINRKGKELGLAARKTGRKKINLEG